MKKTVLLIMLIGFVFTAYSQKQYKIKKKVNLSRDIVNNGVANNLPEPILNYDKSVNDDVSRLYIGKAANYRTVRKEDTRAISYNPELDIITVTFILDPSTYGTNATDIGMIYSADHGETWSEPVVIIDNGDSFINDYPGGIIFNPEGNTVVEDAYGVMSTISHVGGDWGYKMWASMTLGGDDQDIEISHNPNNEEDGYWNQFGLTQIGDQVRCMSMLPTGVWEHYQTASLQPIYGDFEGNDFSWDESQLIDMDLYQNSENGDMAWTGGFQGNDSGMGMEWSEDGVIGYIWMVGVTDDEATGFQPLIYRTEDSGNSWDFIELDFLSDEMQEFFEPYTPELSNGLRIPFVEETSGAVDYHGDLQMFLIAGAHSIDVTEYPDSTGYSIQYPGDLFKMVINTDGMQDIMWIDSLHTQNVVTTTEGNYAGDGWQHRISLAKNKFANEFFITWTDTRSGNGVENNIHPDVFGWSTNIHTGAQSEIISFTEESLYEQYYFFTYGAEKAIYNEETNIYTIPFLQAVNPSEFVGNSQGDPVSLSYIAGIEFPALGDYVGVNDLNSVSSFSVTQNTPNPFNGTTTIRISTETSSLVTVEVSNIIGQTIYTLNSTVNGTKEIELNSNDMEAGVYFYTVTVGNETITKKMIVK